MDEFGLEDFDVVTNILTEEVPEEVSPEKTLKNFRRMLLIARDAALENADVLRLISKYSQSADACDSEAVTLFTHEFVRASRRVCRIEVMDGGSSTGFLVGPDLVLTAAHVFGMLGLPSPNDVTCRFDFLVFKGDRMADDLPVKPRTDVGPDWIVASSPPSFGDESPTATQLDYALIRLAEPVGAQGLRRYRRRRRGWMDGSAAEVPPIVNSEITILQHPDGRLLRFSRGTVKRLATENNRVFYGSDTSIGVSGAPVLNPHKQIVGIHTFERNGGPPNTVEQEGVNFQAIFRDLESKGIRLPRYPPRTTEVAT